MSTGIVLGIAGPAKSGKDTLSNYLVSNMGFNKRLAFADNLKDMVVSVLGLSRWHVDTEEGKESKFDRPVVVTPELISKITNWVARTHPDACTSSHLDSIISTTVGQEIATPRKALQYIGTEICQSFCKTYHVDIVNKQIYPEFNYVISDVRFKHEFDFIKSLPRGYNVKIVRSDAVKQNENIDRKHISENDLAFEGDRFDGVIYNKDGIDSFYVSALEVLKPILGGIK